MSSPQAAAYVALPPPSAGQEKIDLHDTSPAPIQIALADPLPTQYSTLTLTKIGTL